MTKEELGGTNIHSKNGSVDNVVKNEEEALSHIRRFLSYLPSNAWQLPPHVPPDPILDSPLRRNEELLSIIPDKRQATYDIHQILQLVLDTNSFFEIGQTWGCSVIVGFARLNGYVVGILASDCRFDAGLLTAQSSQKLRKHVDLCNTFHIPVVSFVDQPGFAIGLEAEQQSTLRYGATLITSLYQATVPFFTIIIRKAFGVGGAALVDRGGMRGKN